MDVLTAESVLAVLRYEPATGAFYWRVKPSPRLPTGCVAGSVQASGYRAIKVCGKYRLAHRLAWLVVHGQWPDGEIDHINCMPDDNRIANLRLADRHVNAQNKRRAAKNKKSCNLIGVFKNGRKWAARVNVGGRRVNFGTYGTPEEAHVAYVLGKRALHAGCTL